MLLRLTLHVALRVRRQPPDGARPPVDRHECIVAVRLALANAFAGG